MTGLLPHVMQHAVAHESVFVASQSFGVVALTLLVLLLLELQALHVAGVSRARRIGFSICSAPLLVALAMTIAARFVILVG